MILVCLKNAPLFCARNSNFLAGSVGLSFRAKATPECVSPGPDCETSRASGRPCAMSLERGRRNLVCIYFFFAIRAVDHSNRQGRRKKRRFRREMSSRISDLLSDGVVEISIRGRGRASQKADDHFLSFQNRMSVAEKSTIYKRRHRARRQVATEIRRLSQAGQR